MSFKNFQRVRLDLADKASKAQSINFIDFTKLPNPEAMSEAQSKPTPLDYNDSRNSSDQDCQQDRSSEIREMLSRITKNSNANYYQATQKARTDPLNFRKDRALRRIRTTMSADRYNDILKAIVRMDSAQLLDWITRAEQHLEKIANGDR